MDSKMLLQSNYLDIIFDGRNKAYGSYELRTTYPQRMKKAGVYIFMLAASLTFYTVWANSAKTIPVVPFPMQLDTTRFTAVDLDIPKEPIVPPAPPLKTVQANTVKMTIPDVVVDNKVKPDDVMAKQKDLENAVAGTSNSIGVDSGNISSTNNDGKLTGTGTGFGEGDGKKFKETIPVFVEQMPEFPGGQEKLMEYLSNNIQYPAQAVNAGQQGKVQVKFVVNEDGSISNVITTRGFGFGSEQESIRVVSGMPKWKAGRNNGKPVKVWFQLPVIFKLG
ncbi:MAG: TonB family protein [Chitinophagaceae bacterium]|jgi:protein TonB